MAKVVSLQERRSRQALERLNRLTGLDFRHWPESLLPTSDAPPAATARQRRR